MGRCGQKCVAWRLGFFLLYSTVEMLLVFGNGFVYSEQARWTWKGISVTVLLGRMV